MASRLECCKNGKTSSNSQNNNYSMLSNVKQTYMTKLKIMAISLLLVIISTVSCTKQKIETNDEVTTKVYSVNARINTGCSYPFSGQSMG